MFTLNLKPSHKAVQAYYDELQTLGQLNFYAEGAVSPAFAALLRHCAKQCRLTLVEQYPLKKSGATLRLDGALVDGFTLPHGYWEAKDSADDLDKEIANPRVFDYKLGNRSALEWLIDQYKVSTDKRSALVSDPNRADDPQYIVRLLGQIITVSLETLQLIENLPPLS